MKHRPDMQADSGTMKVIRVLALAGPLTIFSMAKKSSVAVSYVHKIVRDSENGLERRNLVKVHSQRVWRTGLKSNEYVLTFHGLVEYLSHLFETMQMKRSDVKEATKKFRQFYDYPIFTEQEFLEEWLGEKVYDWICSTAWMLKSRPPSIPIITENVSGSLPTIIQSIMRGRPPLPTRWEERILMYSFALVFFDLIAVWFEGEKISPTPNPALLKLVDETYRESEEALQQRLKGAKKLKAALKRQFSA